MNKFPQMEAAKIAYMRNCWLARKEPHPCDVFKAKLLKNLKGHASTVRTESKKVLNCFLLRTKEASSGAAKMGLIALMPTRALELVLVSGGVHKLTIKLVNGIRCRGSTLRL